MVGMTTFTFDRAMVAHVAGLPAVRQAASQGDELVSLWPLTQAMQMDNDVKYAENLQVRVTRVFARAISGQDVTVPDAEFVYEGADSIPGRPQEIVDALLNANDAYETMSPFSETGDVRLVVEAARILGVDWSGPVADRVLDVLGGVERALSESEASGAAGVDGVAERFAVALMVCDKLLAAVVPDGSDVRAALPVLLVVNELREQIALPRIFMTLEEITALLARRAHVASEGGSVLDATAEFVAPLARAEWKKHYDDVLWNPDEAKKKAKEEDEKRNKEALAAKFAHVKDDPNKETVEL